VGTRRRSSTFIDPALEVVMSLNVESLQDEVMSFLRAREELCEASLPGTSLPQLLSIFDSVWRQAAHENDVTSSEDRQTICSLSADAIIALAKAGVHDNDIRRYALAHVLFMTKPSVDGHH
jgi:hypothetical protein